MQNSRRVRGQQFFSAFFRLDIFDFVEQNIHWLRWVIVGGVFLIAIAIGFLASHFKPSYIALASFFPLLALVGIAFLRKFELFPVIILGNALFVPITFPTGTGSRLAMSMLIVVVFFGLWVLRSFTTDKRFTIKPSPVNFPLLAFFGVVAFSVFWSILFRDPMVFVPDTFVIVQIASALVMIFLPITLLMVGNFIESTRQLKIMAWMMIAAGVVGFIKDYTGLPLPVDIRGMFALWVIGLAFGFAIFIKHMHWTLRAFLFILVAVWIWWNFGINISWVAGWLPALVALAILTWIHSKKLSMLMLAFVLALFLLNSDYYLGKVLQNETQESGFTRLAAWKANWSVTREHLIFGTGPAGYAVYYMTYFPTDAMATHSNYIDLVAQTGIVGTVFCLWFFGSLVRIGIRLSKRLRGRGDFAEALANVSLAGTIACIIIMAFGDWLFPFAYTQTIEGFNYAVYNWLFMGAILVLDRLYPPTMEGISG